jgi:DNA modification methylase
MSETKIVVRTSQHQKNALKNALDERGVTITEWMREQIAEVTEDRATGSEDLVDELERLEDLDNEEEIIEKIESVEWAFTDSDTTYLSHGIHPYSAKFIPQIPHHLIKILSLKGETVWDPFAGSGTTALEALLLGRQAVSSDVNPLSKVIGKAKTASLTRKEESEGEELIDEIELLGSSGLHFSEEYERQEDSISEYVPEIPNRENWFHPNVLKELGYLALRIDRIESNKLTTVARSALSKIIVKVSFQDSETRYTSNEREVDEGVTLRAFAAQLDSTLKKIHPLTSHLEFREATFKTADLRHESVTPDNSVDLIVTSPPYPNATDYHLYHRFRLFWLGYDPRELSNKEIGSHLRHQKEDTGINQYLEEMGSCLHRMKRALRPGRYAVMVVGDSVFDGETFQTAKLVGEVAEEQGFDVVGLALRDVHDTKRSFISAARRLKEEKLLVLRKPSVNQVQFTLQGPNYTPWNYEEGLRRREINSLLQEDLSEDGEIGKDIEVSADPLDVESLRRLTFSHEFQSDQYDSELTWQAVVENGKDNSPDSTRKDSKYATHGVHKYKGKFYPQLAKSMFNLAGLSPGSTVLDPYCGSGTVLLEGFLNGLTAYGLEMNPLAEKISRVKYSILQEDAYTVEKHLTRFGDTLDEINENPSNRDAFNEDCLSELDSWFPEPVVNKLGWISKAIDEVSQPTVRELIEVCLSSIVRKISQQDPKDLRIRRRKPPIDDAPVRKLLQSRIESQKSRILQFSKNSNLAPSDFGEAFVQRADCRIKESYQESGITSETVDAVITSPPYAMALPYIDTDRLSILLLYSMQSKERKNIERNLVGARNIRKSERREYDEKIEDGHFGEIRSDRAQDIISTVYQLNKNADVGFRRKNKAALLYRYYSDLTSSLDRIDEVVRPGGSIFFVIGDNETTAGDEKVKIDIKTSEVLTEMGSIRNWGLVDRIPISVTKEDKKHNKNSITENDIIWFKK